MIRKVMGAWLDVLYPKRCALCDAVLRKTEEGICVKCQFLPKRIHEPYCIQCGRPLTGAEPICEQCKDQSHTFVFGRSAFLYDQMMRRSMKKFKYHDRPEYAWYYAKVLYEMYQKEIKLSGADALVPVPIHQERMKYRGYNQAAVLAKELGRLSGIPVYEELLLRTKKTIPQKELSKEERLQNLCHAFSLNKSFLELSKEINCVIIVDDIYTTGSTIEACARTLSAFGVQKILFFCVCTGKGD